MNRLLRILVIVLLVLLVVQFEFGMAVNLSPSLPELPPFSFSVGAIMAALGQAGPVALVHALLGGLLVLLGLASLVLSEITGPTNVRVMGALAFIALFFSALTGAMFVLSGFQNDGLSHGMATNFILAFVFYFIELYLLIRPASPA